MEALRRGSSAMAVGLPLLLITLLLVCSAPTSATKFTVGDDKGWNPGVNYTIWADKHRPFYVGDWLVFYYQSGMADVVLVDEVAYNKCDASHPITNYSKGRSYAFELNKTGDYYFICSYGYCYQGMKVAIHAQALPPPSPPPMSSPSSSPSSLLLSPTALLSSLLAAAALLRLQ